MLVLVQGPNVKVFIVRFIVSTLICYQGGSGGSGNGLSERIIKNYCLLLQRDACSEAY